MWVLTLKLLEENWKKSSTTSNLAVITSIWQQQGREQKGWTSPTKNSAQQTTKKVKGTCKLKVVSGREQIHVSTNSERHTLKQASKWKIVRGIKYARIPEGCAENIIIDTCNVNQLWDIENQALIQAILVHILSGGMTNIKRISF